MSALRNARERAARTLAMWVAGLALTAAAGCMPEAPPYPYWGPYGSRQGVIDEAKKRSAALEQYIKDWLDGKVAAQIPSSLLPETERSKVFTLVRPENIAAKDQWLIRPAHTIDRNAAYGLYNDPHATYLVNWHMMAPFGSKVIIEGKFPRARFFSVQSLPAFEPENYRHGPYGTGEVSWVDADINPASGHTNPFRVGANRNATSRDYRLVCNVTAGDPMVLDRNAWAIPFNRDPGNNVRHCTGIAWRGPWGDESISTPLRQGVGFFGPGELWVRYYAPDHGKGPLADAGYPKVSYELPDGRRYFIAYDVAADQAHADRRRALISQAPVEPAAVDGPGVGLSKGFSIFRGGIGALAAGQNHPSSNPADQARYTRDMDLGVAGKGEKVGGLGSHESHATAVPQINYLNRGMCLGSGKVFAFAGRLPSTPKTRDGEATMTRGQARYWSVTGYSVAYDLFNTEFVYGAEVTSVMDDEIVTDANGNYILLFGRAADRPANATAANGITWVDWGPEACQGFVIRWLSLGPDWAFEKTPHQSHLGWETDPYAEIYNVNRIGKNNRSGFLADYQPVASYLTKSQFEALGSRPNPQTLPAY